MALKPCKECKKEISTSAKTCPHCGVSRPGTSSRDVVVGIGALVALFGGCVALLGHSGSGDEKGKPAKVSDAECIKSLECWGEKHSITADIVCKPAVEKLAKFSSKWTDGTLETKFSRYGWADQKAGTLRYVGDKIQFQNGFGAMQNYTYTCFFDPRTGSVMDVEAHPGRL